MTATAKHTTVMRLVSSMTDRKIFSSMASEDCDSMVDEIVSLSLGEYEAMGCPREVTVTVEPGDRLNDAAG